MSNFVAKCGVNLESKSSVSEIVDFDDMFISDLADGGGGKNDEETALHSSILNVGHLKCKCNDPNCIYRSYYRSQKRKLRKYEQDTINILSPTLSSMNTEDNSSSVNDLNSGGESKLLSTSAPTKSSLNMKCCHTSSHHQDPSSSSSSSQNCRTFTKIRENLISIIGGESAYREIYQNCLLLSRRESAVFSTKASVEGDTVLMQLCISEIKNDKSLLYGQIVSFINLYDEYKPELLWVRNSQGFNCIELAALDNKIEITKYLTYIYGHYGKDVNESSSDGHTLLHRLARKGDDTADTLEQLLKLRDHKSGKRLFRMDVVNAGAKTPLDVAIACKEMFSTGATRTIYNRTLQIFHKVIEEDTLELLEGSSPRTNYDDGNQLPL